MDYGSSTGLADLIFKILSALVICVVIFFLIEMGSGASWLLNFQARADEAEARKVEAHTELIETRAEAEIDYAAARAVRRDTDLATMSDVSSKIGRGLERMANYLLLGVVIYLWRQDRLQEADSE